MTEIILKYSFEDTETIEMKSKYCCFQSGVLSWTNFTQDMFFFPIKKRSISVRQSIIEFTTEVDQWLDATNSSAILVFEEHIDERNDFYIKFDNERDAVMFKMAWL